MQSKRLISVETNEMAKLVRHLNSIGYNVYDIKSDGTGGKAEGEIALLFKAKICKHIPLAEIGE